MADESQTPESTVSPPSWLDVNFIQKALDNDGDASAKAARITISGGAAAGENYCSTLYRVKVELSDGGQCSLLVKLPPAGAETAEFVKRGAMFRRESEMLASVIPQMQALLQHASPSQPPKPLAPRCLLHGDSPVDFLVLQDLCPLGFRLADRKRGLGLRHSLLALQSLARFHAASHALLRKQPELYESFDNTWRVSNPGMDVYIFSGLQSLADACRTWPGYEKYADRLERNKKKALEKWVELNDPVDGGFNVISHGDYWTNNMLFKYEEGTLSDYRIIDLQTSHVASYALDVVHLIHTSLSEEVSLYHEDLLLREYHNALRETSNLLEIQVPSFQEFLSHFDSCGTYSMFGALCETPVMRAHTAPNLDVSFAGDETTNSYVYHTPEMRRWFQRILPKIDRKGWLPE